LQIEIKASTDLTSCDRQEGAVGRLRIRRLQLIWQR